MNTFCAVKVSLVMTLRATEPLFTLNIASVLAFVFMKLFCKSQFPHKSVHLFLISVIVKDELTALCGY